MRSGATAPLDFTPHRRSPLIRGEQVCLLSLGLNPGIIARHREIGRYVRQVRP
jgi:hypothetical protein